MLLFAQVGREILVYFAVTRFLVKLFRIVNYDVIRDCCNFFLTSHCQASIWLKKIRKIYLAVQELH